MASLQFPVIVSPMFAENTYLVHLEDSPACVVVDPGVDPEAILDEIDRRQLQPQAILLTHGHADHIAGNAALRQRWPDLPIVIGRGDAEKLLDPEANLSAPFGLPLTSPPADKLLDEGDTYAAAGLEFEILETPGHCAGHIVYVYKGESPWTVIGGDVLFREGVGRVDFPDGNPSALVQSIRQKLYTLPDDTRVLPGHGEPTTIGHEKQHNPFVPGV